MDSHLKVESCKHFHATDIRFNGSLQYCSRRRWLHRRISYAPTQGSETHIYDFFAHTVEKNALFVCLCHSVLSVSFVFHCCIKQRTSRFEKAASRQQKIPIMKKHYTRMSHCFENFWITSSVAVDLSCWWINWEGKCQLHKASKHDFHWASNETNTTGNMLLNLFTAISTP